MVVERTEVAAAASGKAGGFLALDWCGGNPLDALARRSFQLHAAMSREFAGDWGYQRMTGYSGVRRPRSQRSPSRTGQARLNFGRITEAGAELFSRERISPQRRRQARLATRNKDPDPIATAWSRSR
ncbi:hypothetical protein [Bradyrhizobium sp. ARR65]|uniref:hypothetical protein n=1 Tax=Bradyrhizobium sp. ARR65 TaxID=1040989 RepID=UPI000A47F04E|nr:hypothetical protein [Bradyrhizobium sp. ARR65]